MKFIFLYLYLSEKAMSPHSSTLAWKIPRTEEPGGLQSMGSLRVAHDWATSFSLFTFMHWRRKWQPTPMFSPGESQGWGSLVGCRLWVTQSRTRLKWLSNLYLCDFFHQLFSDYDNFILSGISVYIYILFFPYVFFSPFFSDSLWYFFLSLLICFLYSHLLFSSPFGFSPIFFFQPLFMLFSPVFLPSLIFYIFSWICYDLSLAFLFYWIKIMASVS